jgi:hypothetical protein
MTAGAIHYIATVKPTDRRGRLTSDRAAVSTHKSKLSMAEGVDRTLQKSWTIPLWTSYW